MGMTPGEMAVVRALAALVEQQFAMGTKAMNRDTPGKIGDLRRAMREIGWPVTENRTKD